jgi:hypothetical protein
LWNQICEVCQPTTKTTLALITNLERWKARFGKVIEHNGVRFKESRINHLPSVAIPYAPEPNYRD